uniref:Pacifastin domain-containing protein n=1 Tax=Anopheles epiroticus TaxID=199890 RepID=A0A182P0U4_9DIPT
MEDCNKCRCGADGQKACTRKMCPPKEQSDDSQVRTDVQNGEALSSVDEREEVVHSNGQVCSPNEIKMKDCNRCRCANNGIGWFCTRRACPQREKRSAPGPDEKCTPGTTFPSKDGCNTCFCTETGMAACTLKLCLDEPTKQKRSVPSPDEKCTPGTTFRSADDCNTCFCSESGMVACTRKACVPAGFYDQKPKQKRSAPRAGKDCTPGTTFLSDDGCNTCFCSESGHAACTMKACLPKGFFDQQKKQKRQVVPADDLPQSKIAPGAPGFSCTPKSSFKYECNTCLCSDDGKMAGCTFKYCIPGEW